MAAARVRSRSVTRKYPLTTQGSITLVAALVALNVYGYGNLDLVVFALAVCALAILAFSFFCTLACGLLIRQRLRQSKSDVSKNTRLEANYPNESGLELPQFSYLPLVKLRWNVVSPDFIETRLSSAADGTGISEWLLPTRRCRSRELVREFFVEDVLGFARFRWLLREEADLIVLPQSNNIRPLPLIRSLTAEDGIPDSGGDPHGDRMEIRPYVAGDSVRNIMWNVYARSRQLSVRLPEKSVHHSNRTIAYLLSSGGDEAAAAVARIALETGALGEQWAFAADGSDGVAETLEEALTAVAASRYLPAFEGGDAQLSSSPSYGLDGFLQAEQGKSNHCIVFAAAEIAPWLAPLQATISRYSGHISLVLATDGFAEATIDPSWKRWITNSLMRKPNRINNLSSRADLQELLTQLGQRVESTIIVDRQSGLSFDRNLNRL